MTDRREELDALLMREYQAIVQAVGRKWRLDEERAADLVHDAVLRVYDSLETFDPKKGELKGWLWGVLRHVSARREKRPTEAASEPQNSPLEDLVLNEVLRFIRASVSDLPDSYRRVVELRFYEGKALGDISRELSVPLGTVKARLSRVPEVLKKILTVQATTVRMVLDQLKKRKR